MAIGFASAAFCEWYLGAPPPRPAHAESAVFSIYNNQASVTSTVSSTVPVRTGRFDVIIEQLSATADIYCGSPKWGAVTTANGMLIPGIKGANATFHTAAEIDCISSGSTVSVSYVEDF
jgi:hypothetical protein